MAPNMSDRASFSTLDSIEYLWKTAELPSAALNAVHLTGDGPGLPSSFKVGHIAQATAALTALAAAVVHAGRNNIAVPRVEVALQPACIEFKSVDLWTLDGKPPPEDKHPIGGLHKTNNGFVRVVDSFPHLRTKAVDLAGLPYDVTAEQVRMRMLELDAEELERQAFRVGATIGALRSFEEWDALPQSGAVSDLPVVINKLSSGMPGWKFNGGANAALSGVKVLDLSRVIAAPVAGRILAAHGADVLWVTSPNLPERPEFDRDTARGKRTIQLDLDRADDAKTLKNLVKKADVIIQSYRPGALAQKGLGVEEVVRSSENGIVYGTLSAFGASGPWNAYRGFDSLVQSVGGFHVAEAQAWGEGHARNLPTQVLDYGSGFLLAFGIMGALHRQATDGGSYVVECDLAATMKYVRSLGQYKNREGFFDGGINVQTDVPDDCLETRSSGFGELRAVKHSAAIEGLDVGWNLMPKPLGSDTPAWLK